MKNILRVSSLLTLILSFGIWWAQGANTGWTKTQVEIQKVDEITGIEFTEYQDKLTLGIELPIGGTVAAVFLFGASFIFRKSQSTTNS